MSAPQNSHLPRLLPPTSVLTHLVSAPMPQLCCMDPARFCEGKRDYLANMDLNREVLGLPLPDARELDDVPGAEIFKCKAHHSATDTYQETDVLVSVLAGTYDPALDYAALTAGLTWMPPPVPDDFAHGSPHREAAATIESARSVRRAWRAGELANDEGEGQAPAGPHPSNFEVEEGQVRCRKRSRRPLHHGHHTALLPRGGGAGGAAGRSAKFLKRTRRSGSAASKRQRPGSSWRGLNSRRRCQTSAPQPRPATATASPTASWHWRRPSSSGT